VHALAPAIALPLLAARAVLLRLESIRRRRKGQLPRVVFGPTPLINHKYWSRSLQRLGLESATVTYGVYPAFQRSDFDRHLDEFGPNAGWLRFTAPYFALAWCLGKADVFVTAYDGGYVAATPLRTLECQLIHLAGKRIVLVPYGSDIAVPGTLGPVEAAVYEAYPDLLRRADAIRERVLYFCRHADFVIRTYQPGYQPRQDLIWPNALGIDADHWQAPAGDRGHDARTAEVVIVHPTNHRSIKGTDALVEATEGLKLEGLHLRLDVIEGRSNEEVRAAMGGADLVAEQFIAGYGLTAIEAMALGRPVLSNLGWLGQEFREGTCLDECPIVDTSPETLQEELRRLALDPALRARLGRAGREYVLKYHSAEAVGRIWKAVLRHVWSRAPLAPKVSAEILASREAL